MNQSMGSGEGGYTRVAYQGKQRDYTPNKNRSKSPTIQPKALPNRFQQANEFQPRKQEAQYPSFRDKDSFHGMDTERSPREMKMKQSTKKIKLQEYPPADQYKNQYY